MILLTPKDRWMKTAECKAFADIANNAAFHRAIEVALAEMQIGVGKADPAGNWQRLEGAKTFIGILLNLTELPKTPKRGVPRENLNAN